MRKSSYVKKTLFMPPPVCHRWHVGSGHDGLQAARPGSPCCQKPCQFDQLERLIGAIRDGDA